MNVLFHVDGVERWNTALTNVRNLMEQSQAQQTPVQIEIVASGEAVRTLIRDEAEKRSGLAESLRHVAKEGVTLAVCGKALEKYCIPAGLLLEETTVVPLGVMELAEKQAVGWAYVRL